MDLKAGLAARATLEQLKYLASDSIPAARWSKHFVPTAAGLQRFAKMLLPYDGEHAPFQ